MFQNKQKNVVFSALMSLSILCLFTKSAIACGITSIILNPDNPELVARVGDYRELTVNVYGENIGECKYKWEIVKGVGSLKKTNERKAVYSPPAKITQLSASVVITVSVTDSQGKTDDESLKLIILMPEEYCMYEVCEPLETLSQIAQHFTGKAKNYKIIQKFNKLIYSDVIHPSQKLRIPKALLLQKIPTWKDKNGLCVLAPPDNEIESVPTPCPTPIPTPIPKELYFAAETKYIKLLSLKSSREKALGKLIELARVYKDWGKDEFKKDNRLLASRYYNRSQFIMKACMEKIYEQSLHTELKCNDFENLLEIHEILKDICQDLESSNETMHTIDQLITDFKSKRDSCNNKANPQ